MVVGWPPTNQSKQGSAIVLKSSLGRWQLSESIEVVFVDFGHKWLITIPFFVDFDYQSWFYYVLSCFIDFSL